MNDNKVAHTYKIGEVIEVIDPGVRTPRDQAWRRAFVTELKPYRGQPGYYIRWCEVPKGPDGIMYSTGGWTHERDMRPAL